MKGYGIKLVEIIKKRTPELQALIFLQRETPEVVHEAMEAGADGVMFSSSIGTGNGDFIQALTTTAGGGIYSPMAFRQVVSKKLRPAPVIADPL